jgi:hypothetical protein
VPGFLADMLPGVVDLQTLAQVIRLFLYVDFVNDDVTTRVMNATAETYHFKAHCLILGFGFYILSLVLFLLLLFSGMARV